jgi:hypothetical protein
MPRAIETIQTRQRAERLFGSDKPLGPGECVRVPNEEGSLVAGFAFVEVFAVSDQPFRIRIFEACRPGGPFITTDEGGTLFSTLGIDGRNSICNRVIYCGTRMKAELCNLGAQQSFLSFCASGLPES